MQQIQISAKNLGAIDSHDFCERCFWLQTQLRALGSNAPWQIFPGIFSSIDVFTKNVIHDYFDRGGQVPPWLNARPFAGAKGYVDPPHHSKFRVLDDAGDPPVLLTGEADGIFELDDGTYLIADYKTARYSKGQDKLLPVYEAQLNAYARIAEEHFGPGTKVSGLALIYMEPPEPKAEIMDDAVTMTGFEMHYRAKVVELSLDGNKIPRLLDEARRLHSLAEMPAAAEGCGHCPGAEHLGALFRS